MKIESEDINSNNCNIDEVVTVNQSMFVSIIYLYIPYRLTNLHFHEKQCINMFAFSNY